MKLPVSVAQVAGPVGVGGNIGDKGIAVFAPPALVVNEEEHFVMDDGTAHGSAEDVLNETRTPTTEQLRCVQAAVTEIFECVAMEFVGAGLGDDIDEAAGITAILSVGVVGNDAEFPAMESMFGIRNAPSPAPSTTLAPLTTKPLWTSCAPLIDPRPSLSELEGQYGVL